MARPFFTVGLLLACACGSSTGGTDAGSGVSRASHKRDIAYLGRDELRAYARELEALPLATWRYNGEPVSAPRRLGFLIDDDEHSPAVDATGERVDLYGYTSWVVAAVKVQAERIAALEAEVKALRRELARRKR